ncbi:hypothetical protein AB0C69_21370 [Actinomadura sp. NPDC048032]|uniref:hypothetical protein n=1 Tax=Actinomadura sp. NPDC048032 TaxID=3155747 RepID=UPI0033C0B4B3
MAPVTLFVRDFVHNKKSLYAITADGRLAQIWDTDRWNVDFPLDGTAQPGLRFNTAPGVIPREIGNNKKLLYAVTDDGRLAQVWDTDRWNLDFPADLAGEPGLRFDDGTPAALSGNAVAGKKIVWLRSDARMAQVADSSAWRVGFFGFPAGNERYTGNPAFFGSLFDIPDLADLPAAGLVGLYAITAHGRLAQITRGNIDFPAELAGHPELRFQGSPAVFGRDAVHNKKSLYAITADGRLAQVWDTDRWNLDFPVEKTSQSGLRFGGDPAVFGRDVAGDKKSIYAVTFDERLVQIWDTDGWNVDFPAERTDQPDVRFRQTPAVFVRETAGDKKSIYAVTSEGRLAQVWDTDRWNIDFPAELAGREDLRFRAERFVL